jgi:octanoyl-[GcvH]:protein N-octanoyltransferase
MSVTSWPEAVQLADLATGVRERDILFPFALDEVIGREVGEGRMPLIHIWRHPRAFVMGLRDRRLPGADKAMNWLREQGYDVAVRNSGGAAVPLDPGVVNLSVILPNPERSLDFRQDFVVMADLIKGALQGSGVRVAAGEIAGAYCPGDYDLSVDGRKFCGIAQRRLTKAYIVQAFVVVEGSGEERRRLVRRFYDIAAGRDRAAAEGCDNAEAAGEGAGCGHAGAAGEGAERGRAGAAGEGAGRDHAEAAGEGAAERGRAEAAGEGAAVATTAVATVKASYPVVESGSMASLAELGGTGTVEAFVRGVKDWLNTKSKVEEMDARQLPMNRIMAMIGQLRTRYER